LICRFANAQGGKLIIGKSDNGRPIGIENSKKLLEDIVLAP
jgi:ATP-dependent DNA helicase RecG